MRLRARLGGILLCTMSGFLVIAQESKPAQDAAPGKILLDVVVTEKSGAPVAGLQQQDFTMLDNQEPQPITSFRAVRGNDAELKVILLLDDVNTGYEHLAFERSEIGKFLRADKGQLAHPTTLALLTDSGLKLEDGFSTDGNVLSNSLDRYGIPLHTILRSGGIYAAAERLDISLRALTQLATQEAGVPGRKLIFWISPGWPLLSGPGVEIQMDTEQRELIYSNVVAISTLLRKARVTLYSIDPLGGAESPGRALYWEEFVKALNKPNDAAWGDVALQVIATQSGGRVFVEGNDIAGELRQCLADSQAYYEISFAPPLDRKPGSYQSLEVQVGKPGLVARTRHGYYVQP
jgi:VWFA-related protein